jgi:iron complex transport system substrate-binding protein
MRSRSRRLGFVAGIAAAILAATAAGLHPAFGDEPSQRIVSLNLCTDQLVMMLAGPERIAAVSHLARDPKLSVLAGTASLLPIINGQAEEVFLLKPDLVVSGSYHIRATVDILKRLGLKVEEFPAANSFADIRTNVRRMGRLLGESEKAEALIAKLDARLQRIAARRRQRTALAALFYANSYTSGKDTLASEVVELAGFDNLASRLGLTGTGELPLEILVMEQPDLVVTGLSYRAPALAQEVFSHPALSYLEKTSGKTAVAENLWICGTPLTVEAVEALAVARDQLPSRTAFVRGDNTDHSRVVAPTMPKDTKP